MFSHPDEHQLEKGPALTTLPVLGKEWSVAFEIKLSSFSGYANCLNLIGESSQEVLKFVLTSGKKFRLTFGYSAKPINDNSMPSVGDWTQIEIVQLLQGGTTKIVFMKNGAVVGTFQNPQPQNVFGVDVFAVKTRAKPQPGTIKKLTIRTDLSGNNVSQNTSNRS